MSLTTNETDDVQIYHECSWCEAPIIPVNESPQGDVFTWDRVTSDGKREQRHYCTYYHMTVDFDECVRNLSK